MAVAAEGVGGAFGYLGGLAEGAAALAPTAGEVAGAAEVGAAATAGLAVGLAGGAAYGLARGTGWVLENTLFRPQQGSKDAAVQNVRSANNINHATQPQHFTLRAGSSTSSPASSRASSQSGFRVQAQSNNTPRPFSCGLNRVALPQSQPNSRASLQFGFISSEPTFAGLRKNKKKKKTRGSKKRGSRKKGKRGFLWQSLTSLEMQPGAKLQRISRGLYFAATRLHAAF